ncbi:MAG: tetraacyldisaccharide 4'-kinase, partial [Bacteroidota bacterium]
GAFIQDLIQSGFVSLTDMRFSDHHAYAEADVATIASFAKAMNADACITTEKDIIRLRSNNELAQKLFFEIPVFYLKIEVEILGGKEIFHTLIDNCLRGRVHNGHWNY